MRPVPGLPQGRSRKPSLADNQLPTPTADLRSGPTTYFLAHEDEVEDEDKQSSPLQSRSTYGVQSLEDTMLKSSSTAVEHLDDAETTGDDQDTPSSHRRSTIRAFDHQCETPALSKQTSRTNSNPRPSPQIPASQPLTPLFLASPGENSSLPSSPKSTSTRSFRPLDDESGPDETGSQAITSGGEDDMEMPSEVRDSSPQLIMPSIRMPSRRPFTQRGRDIGKFKVLIAGATGKISRQNRPACAK